MASLALSVSRYPILHCLASFISTRDLFNLALACKSNYQHILSSESTFNALRRNCLCDGLGLIERQTFTDLYCLGWGGYVWGGKRHIWQDEPIEVRLYSTKCDEVEALPCCKCGINICEECRYYPREWPRFPQRRPHLDSSWESTNVMCLCTECDVRLEEELRGRFLNELCDCDIYTRWICPKCVKEEHKFTEDYYDNYTKLERDGDTKHLIDHQVDRDFYCLCGRSVPQDMRPRCTWCKRRHLPESEWPREWEEVGGKMPIFEEDPCYPPFIGDIYKSRCEVLYPKLPYDGPIWQA